MQISNLETYKMYIKAGDDKKVASIDFLAQMDPASREDIVKFKSMVDDAMETSEKALYYGYQNCLGGSDEEDLVILETLNKGARALRKYVQGIDRLLGMIYGPDNETEAA